MEGEQIMDTTRVPTSARNLGFVSLIFGVLGAVLYWWTPMGMVLSLAGLLVGFCGWMFATAHTATNRLLIVALIVCAAALILNLVIADLGLELVRFHGLRR